MTSCMGDGGGAFGRKCAEADISAGLQTSGGGTGPEGGADASGRTDICDRACKTGRGGSIL